MSRPAEKVKPWHEYRAIFITPERIAAGVDFYNEHRASLERIEADTGVPPEMILVDGCEHGYYMDSAEAYLRAANEMRSWNGACARLVSPENRAKYRQQVQAGFGFYLDM